jgi:hypothetical protein
MTLPRKPPPFQFGLGSLFGLTAVVAFGAAIAHWLGAAYSVLFACPIVGAVVGAMLALAHQRILAAKRPRKR